MPTSEELKQMFAAEEEERARRIRRVEYFTTTRYIDKYVTKKCEVLDINAKTGAYAFYLAEKRCMVTALDDNPRYVQYLDEKAFFNKLNVNAYLSDGTSLRHVRDESQDVVLNLGGFYRERNKDIREFLVSECSRVLRPKGLLFISYIPRLFINVYTTVKRPHLISKELLDSIRDTGLFPEPIPGIHTSELYFASFEEMENLLKENGFKVLSHISSDGMGDLAPTVDGMSDKEYKAILEHFWTICADKSFIGMTNHALIIAKKK